MNELTREEAEARLMELGTEIGRIAKGYGVKGFLNCSVRVDEGYVGFFDSCWKGGEDEDSPLEYRRFGVDFGAQKITAKEMTAKEAEARIGELGADLGKAMKAYGLEGEFSLKIKAKDGRVVTSFGYREEDDEPETVFRIDIDAQEAAR